MSVLTTTQAIELTPSDVYAQVLQIAAETSILKRHFKITDEVRIPPVLADLKPRHGWSKCYTLLIKISIMRRQRGLMYVEPAYLEPSQLINPSYVWEQTQRILTEIAILKRQLDITEKRSREVPTVVNKQPIDVFNKLNEISRNWDLLLGKQIAPDQVYSEAMRINNDVDTLLQHWNVLDDAVLPKKIPDSKPSDSLQAAFGIMEEVQRLQMGLNIATVDFSPFRKDENTETVPEDVFNLLELILMEIQTIKAQQGLSHEVTRGAVYVERKTPTEVRQLLDYILAKIRLISTPDGH